MIKRELGAELVATAREYPVVAVLGPRANSGAVLYSGDEHFNFKGVEVLNPLAHEDDWRHLLASGK